MSWLNESFSVRTSRASPSAIEWLAPLLGGRTGSHVADEPLERPQHGARDERGADRRDENGERTVEHEIATERTRERGDASRERLQHPETHGLVILRLAERHRRDDVLLVGEMQCRRRGIGGVTLRAPFANSCVASAGSVDVTIARPAVSTTSASDAARADTTNVESMRSPTSRPPTVKPSCTSG